MPVENITELEAVRLAMFYQAAEEEVRGLLARALLRGNQTEYLLSIQSNIEAILKDLRAGSRIWCEEAIPRCYIAGAQQVDTGQEVNQLARVIGFGAIHQQACQILAENIFNRLDNVCLTIGRRTDDIFRTLALENIKGTVAGYQTWKQAAKNLRKDLEARGITGFVDRTGRRWNMKTYTEMVARTSTMEAHLSGTANRILENGGDLVRVSSHINSCPNCSPYQGKTLSLTGRSQGYETLENARANGLFHPNCRHTFGFASALWDDLSFLVEPAA